MEEILRIVVVRPYHWSYKDRVLDECGKRLCIDIWALDINNDPYLLRVQDFSVLCMLELPAYVNGSAISWNEADVDLLMNELSFKLKGVFVSSYKLRRLKKIYYYRGDRRYPFLQVFFQDLKSMYDFKSRLDNHPLTTRSFGSILLRVWETDINPVRKLQTAINARPCDWIKAVGEVPEERISIVDREYIVKYSSIFKIPEEECISWFIYPGLVVRI